MQGYKNEFSDYLESLANLRTEIYVRKMGVGMFFVVIKVLVDKLVSFLLAAFLFE